MHTSTLLLVVGCVVVVKTSLIVLLVARRDRRQRRALAAAGRRVASPEVPREVEPAGWRLQWAEPGVLLVQNASDKAAARRVELSATLTASDDHAASAHRTVRFVGTGACFEVRFTELEDWLSGLAAEGAAGSADARERLASTLSYSLAWLDAEDEPHAEGRPAHRVLPVPDLALETV